MKYGREKEIMGRKHLLNLSCMNDSTTIWELFIQPQASEYRNDLKIVDALDQGRSQGWGGGGGAGVHVTPLCKPFCKQTTYNIQVTIW